MKVSIGISIFIVFLAAGLRWNDHQRLVAAGRTHDRLMTEATRLGFVADPSSPAALSRLNRGNRENRDGDVKALATEFFTFLRDRIIPSARSQPDYGPDYQVLLDRLDGLDGSQLKVFLNELLTQTPHDTAYHELMWLGLYRFSNKDPVAALNFIAITPGCLTNQAVIDQLVSNSLSIWAGRDPMAAIDWTKTHEQLHPELITDRAKAAIFSSIALEDPKLAFSLLGQLPTDATRPSFLVTSMIFATTSIEQRTALLTALRDHLTTIADSATRASISREAMWMFSQRMVAEGYEPTAAWIATVKLSPEEMQSFVSSLPCGSGADSGKWIEWIGENVSAEKASDNISVRMRTWAEGDYKAAGEWLATTPAGSTKNLAISSYVEILSHHAPENAIPWALELPAGRDHERALYAIHRNWPKTTPPPPPPPPPSPRNTASNPPRKSSFHFLLRRG
jgi:hypothetical protein